MTARILILAETSDKRIQNDVGIPATQIGFQVKYVSTLGEALISLGILQPSVSCDSQGTKTQKKISMDGADPTHQNGFYDVIISKLGKPRDPSIDPLSHLSGNALIQAARLVYGKQIFFLFYSATANQNPHVRWSLFENSSFIPIDQILLK